VKLASKGARVIINYNGSEATAQEAVKLIEEAGGEAWAVKCDVSDFASCGELAKKVIDKYGRIDILVNNAGVTRDGLIMRMSEEDYDTVLDINLKGAFNTIRHFSPNFLKQRSGKIINISSVSGVLGNAGQANYCASKAGLIGLTKSVARELASRCVCVNAVAPGFIETEMTEAMSDKAKEAVTGSIPMKKTGQAEDIAEAVAFLADEASDYITGQVLCVDGGMAI
ncbi:MAG: 3-oxoacyl-[Lachnospiraceae bacterium]|nr:3-oxoacyl-[acyl-carrier-protein] reductase [Lachnospiraceae bacterium]